MNDDKIPSKYNPQYRNLIQALINRKLILNFGNGKTEAINLNKEGGLFDISLKKRQKIVSMRLLVNREVATISTKIDNDCCDAEGFFYHLMEREHGLSGAILGMSTPITRERIGFCYNAQGEAVEYVFDYSHIIAQMVRRDQQIDELQDLLDITFDEEEEDKLRTKLQNLVKSKLSFTIEASKEFVNVFDLGLNVPQFYDMTEEEQTEVGIANKVFRRKYLDLPKEKRDTHRIEYPQLPRLPWSGEQPKAIFQTRGAGVVGESTS